jgi:hypothetical protein
MNNYTDYGIDVGGKTSGEIQTTCPECSEKRVVTAVYQST